MSTFLLIAIPAGCFVVMVGLLAFGLCRAAAAGDRQQAGPPSVDPGAWPLGAPGSTELLSLDSIDWEWKRWE